MRESFFWIISGLLFLPACYDRPQSIQDLPIIQKSCVESMMNPLKNACVGYRFSTNPLAVTTKKASVFIETPRQSNYFWVYDQERKELLAEVETQRKVKECSLGLIVRTLVEPLNTAGALPVILLEDHMSHQVGELVQMGPLCGLLEIEFENDSSIWLIASQKNKCPNEPSSEFLMSCLSPLDRQKGVRIDWSGENAKKIFEKNHQYYLDTFVRSR